jgi:hypothetical protein
MLEMLNPIMVVSVEAPHVNMVAGDVPTAVSVSDKNAFAISFFLLYNYTRFYLICQVFS